MAKHYFCPLSGILSEILCAADAVWKKKIHECFSLKNLRLLTSRGLGCWTLSTLVIWLLCH